MHGNETAACTVPWSTGLWDKALLCLLQTQISASGLSFYFFRELRFCANLPYRVREDKHSGSMQLGGLSHSDSLSGCCTPPAHDLPLAPKTDLQMLHRAMFPADKGKGTAGQFLAFLFWIHMGQRQGGKRHSQQSPLDAGLTEICLCQHLHYEPYRG